MKKERTHEKIDKANDKTINENYAKYKQGELNEKVGKTGRAFGKMHPAK